MIISSKTAVECALTGGETPRISVNHRGFSSRAAGHVLGQEAFVGDGNLWPVADDLFGLSGIDVYYEVDRGAGMDLDRLRSMYPRLTLMGNISSQTMAQGTTAAIRSEVESCMATARRAGRVIVGVSNYVMPETPARNIDALLEYIREMRSIA